MISLFNKLLRLSWFSNAIKLIMLAVLSSLIIIGFTAFSTDHEILEQLKYTNLGTILVWSYWWPFVIITAIIFSRFWCMICPIELITSFFAKFGFKMKRPKWLLSGWVIAIYYTIILFIGVHIFNVNDNPTYMSLYLISIVSIAVLAGIIFEKNTFCRYVCPIGFMLGLYAKLSFIGWRVKSVAVCKECKDKSCIHVKYRYNLSAKSCGVDINPATINSNEHCILCAGCVKSCGNNQAVPSQFRPNPLLKKVGFAGDLFKLKPLQMAEVAFLFILSGHVIFELFEEWSVTQNIMTLIPDSFIRIISADAPLFNELITLFIIILGYPFFFWFLPYILMNITGNKILLKEYFTSYGLAFLPIIAAVHLAKSVVKAIGCLPYFNYSLHDVSGINTANSILRGNINIGHIPIWTEWILSFIIISTIITGIYLSVKVIRKQNIRLFNNKQIVAPYLIPILYGGIFIVVTLFWRFTSN